LMDPRREPVLPAGVAGIVAGAVVAGDDPERVHGAASVEGRHAITSLLRAPTASCSIGSTKTPRPRHPRAAARTDDDRDAVHPPRAPGARAAAQAAVAAPLLGHRAGRRQHGARPPLRPPPDARPDAQPFICQPALLLPAGDAG